MKILVIEGSIMNKKWRLIYCLLVWPLISGCFAMVAKGKLNKVEDFPDMSRFTSKPAVHLLLPQHQQLSNVIFRVTEESQLFRSVTLDMAEANQADYTINMNLTHVEGEMGTARTLAAVVNILCITPYGVPLPWKPDLNYRLTAWVKDRTGTPLGTYNIEESVTVWCGLSLLALAPMTYSSEERLWENMVKVLYRKIFDDGLLVYSSRSSPLPE